MRIQSGLFVGSVNVDPLRDFVGNDEKEKPLIFQI